MGSLYTHHIGHWPPLPAEVTKWCARKRPLQRAPGEEYQGRGVINAEMGARFGLLGCDDSSGAGIAVKPGILSLEPALPLNGVGDIAILDDQGAIGFPGLQLLVVDPYIDADTDHGGAGLGLRGNPVTGIGLAGGATEPNPAAAFSALLLCMSQPWASVTWVHPAASSC